MPAWVDSTRCRTPRAAARSMQRPSAPGPPHGPELRGHRQRPHLGLVRAARHMPGVRPNSSMTVPSSPPSSPTPARIWPVPSKPSIRRHSRSGRRRKENRPPRRRPPAGAPSSAIRAGSTSRMITGIKPDRRPNSRKPPGTRRAASASGQQAGQALPDRRPGAEHEQEQRFPGQPLGVIPGRRRGLPEVDHQCGGRPDGQLAAAARAAGSRPGPASSAARQADSWPSSGPGPASWQHRAVRPRARDPLSRSPAASCRGQSAGRAACRSPARPGRGGRGEAQFQWWLLAITATSGSGSRAEHGCPGRRGARPARPRSIGVVLVPRRHVERVGRAPSR